MTILGSMFRIGYAAVAIASVLLFVPEAKPAEGTTDFGSRFEKGELAIRTRDGLHKFRIEIAADRTAHLVGLMFRRELARDGGMLFLYDRDQVLYMWMKDTFIALDMIFIDRQGRIASIAENTTPLSTETISSGLRVRAVLELNGGTARRLGLVTGNCVVYEGFACGQANAKPQAKPKP